MLIYLTRHGETVWNTEGRMQGRQNSDLTQKGIAQAEALQQRFAFAKFNKVYSSPSERALITAGMIAGDAPVIIDERLLELGMGEWEGLQVSYVKNEFPEDYKVYWETPHLSKINGMESFTEILKRTREFISDVTATDDENILIVSHGVTLKAIMHIWENGSVEKFWDGGFFKQTAVGIVKCDKQLNGEIIKCYDTSHLSDEEESSYLWKKQS
ncbi:MAG: histidine phosphatase family protein [Defluviitaleaceae bacterium]|nr:histidine phosphatase family protein [Defluviitaleaceae bacterium]